MSAPRPFEAECLADAEYALAEAVGRGQGHDTFELRLQVLEAAAALFGGFDLSRFHQVFGVSSKTLPTELVKLAGPVASAIARSQIQPALALSALARESLNEQKQKDTGAYHTDFRLATRLAQLAAPNLTHKSKVIDPASGAGILLAALTHLVCGTDRAKAAYWLAHGVCAADLSENSLRAALLSLASFTDDLEALRSMRNRWYCGDSLFADSQVWTAMAPDGFDVVIGNPPWEKIKLSKHEFIKSSGTKRHYGSQIRGLDEERYALQRNKVANYSRRLLQRYEDLGNGEPDLYIAFTDLFFKLCKEHGTVAALIPGGFIRSQGTQVIRQKIFKNCRSISISVIDNRARFFSIDTRFKFLAVTLVKAGSQKSKRGSIQLLHERGTCSGLEVTGTATIGRTALVALRPDLSLPEVRSVAEWTLFSKIVSAGISWVEPGFGWTPKFCREVDMTKDRPKFLSCATSNAFPLIEGRMVQSHRFGVKGYVSGTGRRAVWEAHAIGSSRLAPQFWVLPFDVPPANQHRVNLPRVGFCDVAGQTNERSLMAAFIPPNVVCGNKVPTIIFPEDQSEDRMLVWIAIANSFVFDWMLRRVLTTSVNYFHLQSLPLPRITKDSLTWRKLARASSELRLLDRAGTNPRTFERMASLRAEIDAEVAVAYGLDLEDMELVLQDFPILDRGQIALRGEAKSTITKDIALAAVTKLTARKSSVWVRRAADALRRGALAYVPSELALGGAETEEDESLRHGE